MLLRNFSRLLVYIGLFVLHTGKLGANTGLILENDRRVCDRVASIAAAETGVPLPVLKAIARVETGRTVGGKFVPWPWTANAEGAGQYFASKSETIEFVRISRGRGLSSIDIGCFQINLKWHGDNFRSVEQALDPLNNALYAARFLRDLHTEFGDWEKAAGAFHSRNTKFATPYRDRFRTVLASIDAVGGSSVKQPASTKRNAFPLLKGVSNSPSRGSLFPQTSNPMRSLFQPPEQRG